MTVNAKWVLVGLLFLTITGEHLASEPLNSNARSGMSKVQIQTVLAQSNRSEDEENPAHHLSLPKGLDYYVRSDRGDGTDARGPDFHPKT